MSIRCYCWQATGRGTRGRETQGIPEQVQSKIPETERPWEVPRCPLRNIKGIIWAVPPYALATLSCLAGALWLPGTVGFPHPEFKKEKQRKLQPFAEPSNQT